MRVALDILNDQVNYLAAKVAGGAITLYDGEAPIGPSIDLPPFAEPLLVLRLPSPAFSPAKDGKAIAKAIDSQGALRKGEASWARLTTATGEVVADLEVASKDSPAARDADIVISESDLRRGDIVTARSVVLRLPV